MGALRLALAFGVMFWHIRTHRPNSPAILDGGLCVLLFFMISGFYMSLILHEKYMKLSNGEKRFFINRFLRIFPLYTVVLILQQLDYSLLGVPTVFTNAMAMPLHSRLLLIFMNIFKFGQDFWQTMVEAQGLMIGGISVHDLSLRLFGQNAIANDPGHLLVGQGWSLGSELIFYLVAPLVVFRKWKWVAVLTALAFSLRMFLYLYYGDTFMGSLRAKFFPGIMIFFLMGHVSYLILTKMTRFPQSLTLAKGVSVLIAALFIWGIIVNNGLLIGVPYDSWRTWLFYLLIMIGIPCIFLVTRRSRLDNVLGQFSYPVYLVHSLTIERVVALDLGEQFVTGVVIATLAVSAVLILFVEKPINRLRERIARDQ